MEFLLLDGLSINIGLIVESRPFHTKCSKHVSLIFLPILRGYYKIIFILKKLVFLDLLGGHPHNWTAISRECLNLLNDMTQKLVLYQKLLLRMGE